MNNIRFLLYSMLLMIYILGNFVDYDFLPFVIGVLALIVLTISFFRSSGLYKKSGIVFFIAGFLLFIYNGLSWQSIFLYFDSMLGVLSSRNRVDPYNGKDSYRSRVGQYGHSINGDHFVCAS